MRASGAAVKSGRNSKRKTPGKRKPARRKPVRSATAGASDPLDAFILSAARSLDLKIEKAWMRAVRANLRMTLALAAAVEAFALPDGAEPAPVFRA